MLDNHQPPPQEYYWHDWIFRLWIIIIIRWNYWWEFTITPKGIIQYWYSSTIESSIIDSQNDWLWKSRDSKKYVLMKIRRALGLYRVSEMIDCQNHSPRIKVENCLQGGAPPQLCLLVYKSHRNYRYNPHSSTLGK